MVLVWNEKGPKKYLVGKIDKMTVWQRFEQLYPNPVQIIEYSWTENNRAGFLSTSSSFPAFISPHFTYRPALFTLMVVGSLLPLLPDLSTGTWILTSHPNQRTGYNLLVRHPWSAAVHACQSFNIDVELNSRTIARQKYRALVYMRQVSSLFVARDQRCYLGTAMQHSLTSLSPCCQW